jgi:hypothetical protein
VLKLVQRLSQADLVQQLQGRRVDGVAAKITVEIFVLFQQRDRHTLPGK